MNLLFIWEMRASITYDNLGHSMLCRLHRFPKWKTHLLEHERPLIEKMASFGSFAAKAMIGVSPQDNYGTVMDSELADRFFLGDVATLQFLRDAYDRNKWLTFKQAIAIGGAVRKGEKGTTAVYADSFIPKKEQEAASQGDGGPRRVAFLKRFTLFNIAQCDGLPSELFAPIAAVSETNPIPAAESLLALSGATIQRGGERAYYNTGEDFIRIPEQSNFFEPINFYRTALHELTHWTGHKSRLARDFSGRFGNEA
jgi:hypothetical protein